jgi:prepilin peptidase CpaA
MDAFSFGVLMVLLLLAAAWDLLRRKVPNALTIPAALAGLIHAAVRGGAGGLALAAGIAGAVLVAGFLLNLAGAIGGGDAKLLAAMAALGGGAWFAEALVWIAAFSVIASLALLARKRALFPLLGRFGRAVVDVAVWQVEPVEPLVQGRGHLIPFAVVIAAGGTAALMASSAGWSLLGVLA